MGFVPTSESCWRVVLMKKPPSYPVSQGLALRLPSTWTNTALTLLPPLLMPPPKALKSFVSFLGILSLMAILARRLPLWLALIMTSTLFPVSLA